jgi:excinuclease UvrABC ATPase subunit
MVDATLRLPADTRLMILAPVVRDRKGEFVDLFADMQAQGYVRFRVDGKTVEAADVPKLKKAEKHDIDVVIDRIRVQPGIEQRLAESYEAALRIADGRAWRSSSKPRSASRRRQARRRSSICSRASSPARSATIRCPSSSRACSPSTRRSAPARPAAASA